jgi:hypothetical protein
MMNLALLPRVHHEDEYAALAVYRRAISGPDPDLAAEAMIEVGHLHAGHRDLPAARACTSRRSTRAARSGPRRR